jgi:hypothetical protein
MKMGARDDLAKESDPAADAAADRSERYALATDILAGAAIASGRGRGDLARADSARP